MRYGKLDAQGFTEAGGLGNGTNYYTIGFLGLTGVALTTNPFPAVTGVKAKAFKPSWKASATFKPTDALTTYATFSTGFRAPIVNAFAGRPSLTNPADIIIPFGATSDDLKSYEVGAKARWLDGRVNINFAAYYIDWSNIQAQANRTSDQVQFATNIGAAVSKGFEVEMALSPGSGFNLGFNAAYNDSKITRLSPTEAAISGAVLGHRLSAPRLQGSAYVAYSFDLAADMPATLAANVQHVGSYNSSFPNTPGNPNLRLATFGETDDYTNVNLSLGVKKGRWSGQLYVENVFDDHSIVYIHPEAFLASRFGTLRPRTIGIRVGYGL